MTGRVPHAPDRLFPLVAIGMSSGMVTGAFEGAYQLLDTVAGMLKTGDGVLVAIMIGPFIAAGDVLGGLGVGAILGAIVFFVPALALVRISDAVVRSVVPDEARRRPRALRGAYLALAALPVLLMCATPETLERRMLDVGLIKTIPAHGGAKVSPPAPLPSTPSPPPPERPLQLIRGTRVVEQIVLDEIRAPIEVHARAEGGLELTMAVAGRYAARLKKGQTLEVSDPSTRDEWNVTVTDWRPAGGGDVEIVLPTAPRAKRPQLSDGPDLRGRIALGSHRGMTLPASAVHTRGPGDPYVLLLAPIEGARFDAGALSGRGTPGRVKKLQLRGSYPVIAHSMEAKDLVEVTDDGIWTLHAGDLVVMTSASVENGDVAVVEE